MAAEIKSSAARGKPSNQEKGKADSSLNKRKAESSGKQKSVSTLTKSEVKTKASTPSSSKTTATTKTTTVKVREKKVYTLPGQRYDPPEEREPLRIFYESLSEQIPSSEMAEFWLMEHGLLSSERAKRVYERKQRRQKELRMGTPTKSPKPPIRAESSQRQRPPSSNGDVKAKKKIMKESDDDDDDDNFVLSHKRRKG